ncbi:MAG: putative quinol monooxygenase [Stellaceae bacterium]
MELFVFARFHAREGKEAELAALLREQVPFVRSEPGCLMIDVYRSTRDRRLFFIHSRWTDEAAFEVHAELGNTVDFIARAEALIDHPLDVTRSRPLG